MKEKFIGVFLALVGLTIILIKEDLDTNSKLCYYCKYSR